MERSMTSMAKPNLLRNKCLARKACTYWPLLDQSGSITCHATDKIFCTNINITCRSSNLVYCITEQNMWHKLCGSSQEFRLKDIPVTLWKNQCLQKTQYTGTKQQDKDSVGTHFSSEDKNGIEDLEVTVLAFFYNSTTKRGSFEI